MNRTRQYILAAMIVTGLLSTAGFAVPAYAGSPSDQVQRGLNAADTGSGDRSCGPAGGRRACTLGDTIRTVINILLFIIGVVSVVMIIIGGLKYTLSNGDSSQITSAKNTILYSVIGLVIALLAFAIVNFVVGQFT